MPFELNTPTLDELGTVVGALRGWQDDGLALQLHPGDVGWFWRFGAEATAAALRTWSHEGELLAIGLLDGPDLIRMTVAPHVWDDDELADRVVADVSDPDRGVLPDGTVSVESPNGARVHAALAEAGWSAGEPWTTLCNDFSGPMHQDTLRIEVVRPETAPEYAAIVRSAFNSTRFVDERWHAMMTGALHTEPTSLLGYDDEGVAVAEITVWSAGPGRPGLIEPMGVLAGHRGRGYGVAICRAAAAELARLGASSAQVCTRSANVGAVATYASAGYRPQPERLDRTREA